MKIVGTREFGQLHSISDARVPELLRQKAIENQRAEREQEIEDQHPEGERI